MKVSWDNSSILLPIYVNIKNITKMLQTTTSFVRFSPQLHQVCVSKMAVMAVLGSTLHDEDPILWIHTALNVLRAKHFQCLHMKHIETY